MQPAFMVKTPAKQIFAVLPGKSGELAIIESSFGRFKDVESSIRGHVSRERLKQYNMMKKRTIVLACLDEGIEYEAELGV